jgi:hypothetical protein
LPGTPNIDRLFNLRDCNCSHQASNVRAPWRGQ